MRVDVSIPYGNAAGVAARNGIVRFAAHPHGGPESLWFCFRVIGRVRQLVLQHVGNMLGGWDGRNLRPVIRQAGRDWERLPAGETVVLPDGRIEIVWNVRASRRHLDVAVCYPYGQPEVDALPACYRQDIIGVSQAGRPLVRVSNGPGKAGSQRPGIYLIARQHSGETPGSWVLDGLLREMAGRKTAPLIWCVPLANIDGIEQGDYGKDNFPHDLNRAWGRPPMRHETLVIGRDVTRFRQRCRPVLALDFHAPALWENAGLYLYLSKDATHRRAMRPWVRAFQANLTGQFAAGDFGRIARYPSRWNLPTFGMFGWERLRVPTFSIEAPYCMIQERVLTRPDYQEAGARLARAILEQLKRV